MSFKREECSQSYTSNRNLQRRRVRELLSENIPEEEALLMKNGRFCCLVCTHRPIFDTVKMLSVHRGGKKHQASEMRLQEDAAELRQEVLKRDQLNFLKTGKIEMAGSSCISHHSNPVAGSTGAHLLTGSHAQYDPRVKKTTAKGTAGRKITDRKQVVDLHATSVDSLSGFTPQTITDYRRIHGAMRREREMILKPYSRETQHNSGNDSSCSTACIPTSRPAVSQSATRAVSVGDKRKMERGSGGGGGGVRKVKCNKTSATAATPQPQCGPQNKPAMMSEQQKKYLIAIGAGWKRDFDGRWVRDENAEFESDEEPPDIP